MKEYRIETGLGELCEKEIERTFYESDCAYEKRRGSLGANYTVSEEEPFRLACLNAVGNIYKYKEILSELKEDGTDLFYAVLGAVMSVERDSEREELAIMLAEETAINLDGFFDFNLSELRSVWRGVGRISSRLYAGCRCEKDKISLLLYLLNFDEKRGKTVKAVRGDFTVDGKECSAACFVEDRDKNFLLNLFLYRPEFIEITDCGLKKETVSFLKKISDLTTFGRNAER